MPCKARLALGLAGTLSPKAYISARAGHCCWGNGLRCREAEKNIQEKLQECFSVSRGADV